MKRARGIFSRDWFIVVVPAVLLPAAAVRPVPVQAGAGKAPVSCAVDVRAVAGITTSGGASGAPGFQGAGQAGGTPVTAPEELLVRAGARLHECDPGGARDLWAEALRRSAADSSAVEEAMFRTAEIDFMTGQIDSAVAGLDSLMLRFPQGRLVNDALELALFLEDGMSVAPGDVKTVGACILEARCGQLDTAAGKLDSLASVSVLGDRILLVKCELERQGTRYGSAVASLERLLAGFGGSRFLPRARHMLGRIYEEDIKASDTSIDVYERLIVDYPQSPHADDARLRLKRLKAARAAKQGT